MGILGPTSRGTEHVSEKEDKQYNNESVKDLRRAQNAILDLCHLEMKKGIDEAMVAKARAHFVDINRFRIEIKGSRAAFELADLDREFAQDVNEQVLPPLCTHAYDKVPVPGERSDTGISGADDGLAMDIVSLIKWIYDNETPLCGNILSKTPKLTLATQLADVAQAYHRKQKEELDAGDTPDLANISADQLRLDVLIWFLEMLEADAALKSIRTQAFATARAAIDATDATVKKYIDHRGLDEQLDFGAVLAGIEDLVDLTNRIIEADNRARKEQDGIIITLGEDSITALVDSLGMAILAVFQDIERRLESGSISVTYLETQLARAERIHGFCSMLDKAFGERVFAAIRKAISEKTQQLVTRLLTDKGAGNTAEADEKLRLVEDFLEALTRR